jgi:hypothetical protein
VSAIEMPEIEAHTATTGCQSPPAPGYRKEGPEGFDPMDAGESYEKADY